MKSRVRKFQPDRGWRVVGGALALLIVASACHTPGLLGEARQHPPELIGAWIDSAKTTSADTALWILGASGEDATQHVVRDSSAHGAFVTTPKRHYGYWYLEGAWGEPAHRTICFTNRPGRSAPSCATFQLDSVPSGGVFRRRLVVYGYRGAHHSADRVLLARAP